MIKYVLRKLFPQKIWNWLSAKKLALKIYLRVFIARFYHFKNVIRIRAKVRRGEKITVLFIVNEISKWKCQSLYNALLKDKHYNVILGVTFIGDHFNDKKLLRTKYDEAKQYFRCFGGDVIDLYDIEQDRCLDLRSLKPDVIFNPQSWYNEREHSNLITHKFALPCYVPYYVPNYGDLSMDTRMLFHRYLAFYFTLNDGWTKEYKKANPWYFTSGKYVTSGHPMLDNIRARLDVSAKKTIVYAPHWTFTHPKNHVLLHYSTFLKNGLEILEYAKRHTEFNWIFKPHPLLKDKLVATGAWTKDSVDAYYLAWDMLGGRCEDCGYAKLFTNSDALITDCGSFLTEYAVTGKPIIHLISKDNALKPLAPSAKLYETYYRVKDLDEMYEAFDRVLVKGDDYKREERVVALKAANLMGVDAARNILQFFNRLFKCQD